MSNRTLIICKPDAVERGLVGEIVRRIEGKQLTITAMEEIQIDEPTAKQHYAEHDGKPFFENLVRFITSGPVVVMVVEGENAQPVMRVMIGATDPAEAAPGTIRGDLALDMAHNLVHASDSPESAEREIKLFFPEL